MFEMGVKKGYESENEIVYLSFLFILQIRNFIAFCSDA